MLKGVILALSACFVWGLIFVIPTYLHAFSPIEIALGRHFVNGLTSLFFFCFCFKKLINLPKLMWFKALKFALIVNIIYYTCIVLGVQLADAAITTLIAGIAPITIALYGNWQQNECDYKKLILPCILIFAGLILVNAQSLFTHSDTLSVNNYILGILFASIALIAWSWFVVANTQFLKTCPTLTYFEWASMLGVATLFWVVIGTAIMGFFVLDTSQLQRYMIPSDELTTFLVGIGILGCICSWLGTFLWNSGCTHLPLSLSGQLTIFETLFGLTFVFALDQRLPTLLEFSGILLMLLAVLYCMNTFMPQHSHALPAAVKVKANDLPD
ncbi:MAG: DMT family transporter [Parachlamydiales bacterium]|jgi:drug/metabolite transporter (DMT)-like permease